MILLFLFWTFTVMGNKSQAIRSYIILFMVLSLRGLLFSPAYKTKNGGEIIKAMVLQIPALIKKKI